MRAFRSYLLALGLLNGLLLLLSSRSEAQIPYLQWISPPSMTGTTTGVTTVGRGESLTYEIKQTDKDSLVTSGGAVVLQDNDTTCNAVGTTITSMVPGTIVLVKLGWTGDILTWQVFGTAHSTAGTYVDTWTLSNVRTNNDPRKDEPVQIQKPVRVME